MRVPASPQYTFPPVRGCGITCRVVAGRVAAAPARASSGMISIISVPKWRRAEIMRSVSWLRRAPVIVEGPSASAARISARLVMDLDPGTCTTAESGAGQCGAAYRVGLIVLLSHGLQHYMRRAVALCVVAPFPVPLFRGHSRVLRGCRLHIVPPLQEVRERTGVVRCQSMRVALLYNAAFFHHNDIVRI